MTVMQVTLRVNGTARQVDVAPADSLLDVLRDGLEATPGINLDLFFAAFAASAFLVLS